MKTADMRRMLTVDESKHSSPNSDHDDPIQICEALESQSLEARTRNAAFYILKNRNKEALRKIIEKSPEILEFRIIVQDRHGNRIVGPKGKGATLLQIAAAAGDTNPFEEEKHSHNNDYGIVEMLRTMMSKKSYDEQMQEQFSENWEQVTIQRMLPYVVALNNFYVDLVNTEISHDRQWYHDEEWESALTLARPSIRRFKNALLNIRYDVTVGFIFDIRILAYYFDLFHFDRFLWLTEHSKQKIFSIFGFGSLQAAASLTDIRIMQHGIRNLWSKGKDWKPSLLDLDFTAVPISDELEGLGSTFLFYNDGRKGTLTIGTWERNFESLYQTKVSICAGPIYVSPKLKPWGEPKLFIALPDTIAPEPSIRLPNNNLRIFGATITTAMTVASAVVGTLAVLASNPLGWVASFAACSLFLYYTISLCVSIASRREKYKNLAKHPEISTELYKLDKRLKVRGTSKKTRDFMVKHGILEANKPLYKSEVMECQLGNTESKSEKPLLFCLRSNQLFFETRVGPFETRHDYLGSNEFENEFKNFSSRPGKSSEV